LKIAAAPPIPLSRDREAVPLLQTSHDTVSSTFLSRTDVKKKKGKGNSESLKSDFFEDGKERYENDRICFPSHHLGDCSGNGNCPPSL